VPKRPLRSPQAGWILASIVFLMCSALAAFGQHTTVQDAGGGRKIELDYNSANQVVQTRTIGPDGKLMQKVDYEYQPGYAGPQQTTISYWPDGKTPHIVTRVTYDESSNFTGELAQLFDESGKQIGGHQLTHDPWTNVYGCADWNTAAQSYKPIECPAGEEAAGGAAEARKFTAAEVTQHLEAARKAAWLQRKLERMHPKTLVQPPITTVNREVGLVLPSDVAPGERISGSIVDDPSQYEGAAGITVTRVSVPFESAGEAATLQGWKVEAPGEKPQVADGPITFAVPRGGAGIEMTFRQAGNPAHSVSQLIRLPRSAARQQGSRSFKAPALCLKAELCLVVGPFSGDSSKTFAAIEDRPAQIVAETPGRAYISIPERTEAGARPLFISTEHKLLAWPLTVAGFSVKNGDRQLQAGQSLITFPTLEGPEEIPDPEWRAGNFPPANLALAQKLVPGFALRHDARGLREKRDAKEKGEPKEKRGAEEEKSGVILLVLKNMTPDQVSLRGAKDQMLVFKLTQASFSRGEFKYDLLVEAIKSGRFTVKGFVIPLLAPVTGQEFAITADAAAK
jgi:hypothetical protein